MIALGVELIFGKHCFLCDVSFPVELSLCEPTDWSACRVVAFASSLASTGGELGLCLIRKMLYSLVIH